MAELVVILAFLRIGEDVVGFLGLAEFFLGLRIVLVAVRVELPHGLAVCFFYFISAGIAGNAQHVVKIPLCHVE